MIFPLISSPYQAPGGIMSNIEDIKKKSMEFEDLNFHDFDTIFRFKSYVCGSDA